MKLLNFSIEYYPTFIFCNASGGKNDRCCVFVPVPVSKPRLWPLNSLADRPTCWGQPVTVRCGCTEGTAVHYSWYQEDNVLHHSSDLHLHCGLVLQNSHFYCVAQNEVSRQESEIISMQVMMTADNSCVYVLIMQGKNMLEFLFQFLFQLQNRL